MTLCPLDKNNIDFLKKITKLEFKNSIRNNFYKKVLDGEKFNTKDMAYFVIKDGQENVGTIGYYIPKDDKNAVWLGWFVMKDDCRSKGYGANALSLLIMYIKKIHSNIWILRVYTDIENFKAINFYKRFGFIQEDLNKSKDAVILNYSIDGSPIIQWNKEPIW